MTFGIVHMNRYIQTVHSTPTFFQQFFPMILCRKLCKREHELIEPVHAWRKMAKIAVQ